MPPKRKTARRQPIAHVLGRPRTPQIVQFPFGRARAGNVALSENSVNQQEDRFQEPELMRIDNIPPHVVGEEGRTSASPTAIQPEAQAEPTSQNFVDDRNNGPHSTEDVTSLAEVLQAVEEDNHNIFTHNDAGSSLPTTRRRTASHGNLDDARPSKIARIEEHEEANSGEQVENPLQEPRFYETPQPTQNIPGTSSNLLASAWKYNQYLLVVLERNGIILGPKQLGERSFPYWRSFLEEIDRQIDRQDSSACSKYIPVAACLDWSEYIHGLQCRSAKDAMKRILGAIAPTRRQLAQENSKFCHLVLLDSKKRWINSLISTLSQPIRSVGMRCDAFTPVEMDAILGTDGANTSHCGTKRMLFPFLTFEYNQIDISIADTQGAFRMGLAVKNLVDLHRRANNTTTINGRMSGFSLSFDTHEVKIWGYYPLLDNSGDVRVHRQLMVRRSLSTPRAISCDAINGKRNLNRAWLFVKGLYETWAPQHIGKIYKTVLLLPEYSSMSESEESQDSGKPV